MQAFFIGTNSKYIHTALGIRYVAEYCREQGLLSVHRLEVTVNEPVLSVLTRITEQIEQVGVTNDEPILIGLEVHIWNRRFVLELGELLRKVLPDCFLMLGGPEVMFRSAETFAAVPFVDFIVCGEGEEVVAAFLQRVAQFERIETQGTESPAVVKQVAKQNISQWKELIPEGIAYRRIPTWQRLWPSIKSCITKRPVAARSIALTVCPAFLTRYAGGACPWCWRIWTGLCRQGSRW